MGNENSMADSGSFSPVNVNIRSIGPGDLRKALINGLADFEAMPTHLIFLCLIYPVVIGIFARAAAANKLSFR